MLGKVLKGGAWCATLALTTIGALVFVPDDAWRTFPEPLAPVREKLAEIGVAPDYYRAPDDELGRREVDSESANDKESDVSDDNFFGNRGGKTSVQIGGGDSFLLQNSSGNDETGLDVASLADRLDDASQSESLRDVPSNAPLLNDVSSEENLSFESFSSIDELETSPTDRTEVETVAPRAPASAYSESNEIPPFFAESETELASVIDSGAGNVAPEASLAANESLFVPETGAKILVADADLELENALSEAVALESERESSTNASSNLDSSAFDSTSFARRTKDVFLTLNRIRRERSGALSPEKQSRLDGALDRLAFDVFYNPAQTILEPFYVVAKGDSLASVAAKFLVTPETLGAINGLEVAPDAPLPVGATLKTVRGPAAAELSASKRELLLTFDGLYAGRFAFGLPEHSALLRGNFKVTGKIVEPPCNAVDASGASVSIPGGAPENPLGAAWIALDGGTGLQGTNRPELVGTTVSENGGFIFNNREILQLNILLPIGADVVFVD